MNPNFAILGLVLSTPVAGLSPAGDDPLAERTAALERELPGMLELAELPGLAIAVADASGLRWARAFGVRSFETNAEVDDETVFEAASLGKPVFAHIVLQLVDRGVLELDAPLVGYAPLPDVAHDPRHELLTARHCLTHTVGLPNWRPEGGTLEFQGDPGAAWSYSGEGFVLLQRVAETVTGETLQELARVLIFEPFGMRRSSFVWRNDLGENMAHPHGTNGTSRNPRHVSEGNAASSLLTTASDYARFLSAVLRGERLSKDLAEAMRRPQVDASPGVHWGLGWGLEDDPAGLALWHWGHNGGYRAFVRLDPAHDRAFVYFANSERGMELLRDLVELATDDLDHPALRHLDYASYETPKHVAIREVRAALAQRDLDAAIDRYFALAEEAPDGALPAEVLCIVGLDRLAAQRPDEALVLLRVNAELHPGSACAQECLGDAELAAGEPAAARACYERAEELLSRTATREKLAQLED